MWAAGFDCQIPPSNRISSNFAVLNLHVCVCLCPAQLECYLQISRATPAEHVSKLSAEMVFPVSLHTSMSCYLFAMHLSLHVSGLGA